MRCNYWPTGTSPSELNHIKIQGADPCFISPAARNIAVCPTAPWTDEAVEVHGVGPPIPPRSGTGVAPSAALEPWGIQTISGEGCLAYLGTGFATQGQWAIEECTGRNKYDFLFGLHRRSQPWTVRVAPYYARTLGPRIAIRRAWT